MRTALIAPPIPEPEADESPEFDAWLRQHLDQLHASVLTEPVPERFLQILRAARD